MNDLPAAYRCLSLATAVLLLGCGGTGDGSGGTGDGSGGTGDGSGQASGDESGEVVGDVERDTGAVPVAPADSQTVYVPDYSHIYHGSDRSRYALTTTLSIRNTDPDRSITVTSVRYYDTEGELTRRFLEEPRRLDPLGTSEFVVAEHDTSGGSGANFIVKWSAGEPVSEPVIESVMISTRLGQGVSFTSRGVPIVRTPE